MTRDPRIETLAGALLTYSLDLRPGEKLFIEGDVGCEPLVEALIRRAHEVGALAFFELTAPELRRTWLLGSNQAQLEREVSFGTARLAEMDARLLIKAGSNTAEMADVPPGVVRAWSLARQPYNDAAKRKKWCTLRYPTPSLAQAAGMSTGAYQELYFRACGLDYAGMDAAMDPLVRLMEATDEVRILGPGTDLTFSLEGIPTVKSAGRYNVPDGEVSTAPVRDSANGFITFNVPSPEQGMIFRDVRLGFENGRIVEADGSPRDRLVARLDTDEGARFLGEFSVGVNPAITHPVGDILFDEKMTGSLHVTPGNAYDVIDNGNRSALHWDLVLLQTPGWGGGELWFDGVLVRKDGRFVLPQLEGLNPENLLSRAKS